jgi:serine/threonine-protein kinase
MYPVAGTFALTFVFNVSQGLLGPAAPGFALGSGPGPFAANLIVRSLVPGGPFEKAGVREGDVIEGANGYAVKTQLDWYVVRAGFETHRPIDLRVRRGDRHLQFRFVLAARAWKELEPRSLWADLAVRASQLVSLSLAIFVAFSRPHELSARLVALLFGIIASFNGALAYGLATLLHPLPVFLSLPICSAEASYGYSAALWLAFCGVFGRSSITRHWLWILVVLPGVLGGLPRLALTLAAVYSPAMGLGFSPGWLAWSGAVGLAQAIGGLALLLQSYHREQDAIQRRRLRIVLASMGAGLAAAVAWLQWWWQPLNIAGALVFSVMPLGFAYAVLRHRLFDIQVIIRQGLQYATARGALISLFPVAVGVLAADLVLHRAQPLGDVLAKRGWQYGAIAVVAWLAHNQRQRWMGALDRRFFREQYNAQQLLRETAEELRSSHDMEAAAPRIVNRIEAALHPEFAALMVREAGQAEYRCQASAPPSIAPSVMAADSKLMAAFRLFTKPLTISLSESTWLVQQLPAEDTEFLRQARIELMVPVTLGASGREAFLALGVKRSEEPYSREDHDLLLAIANNSALLLERPAASPSRADSVFEECPRCGACYDCGTGRCARDAAALTTTSLPRLLCHRYFLERRIGKGGMGTVYEARDRALDRRVAAKVIRDDLVGSAAAAERFRREARAAAGFSHPNVVTVHDFGVTLGCHAFLVMELLEGVSLREALRREGRLRADRSLEILRGVCSAVESAHHRRLIHRDLKPENIFLARQETGELPKVLDFGVAKFRPSDTRTTVSTATAAGILVGTLSYMSPEQLRGEAASPNFDLWALAATAYEMLTGKHPFERAGAAELSRAILSARFTPVTDHLPDAPSLWQDFFSRAFALDPSRRPHSAGTLYAELSSTLG